MDLNRNVRNAVRGMDGIHQMIIKHMERTK